MIGAHKKATRPLMLAVASLFVGGLSLSAAQAADLGGNCCADLEERVAELEATTVRKGTNKVSVKLYGQVNKALLAWDDGFDSNAYVVDNDNSSTRIGLMGEAKVTPSVSAGFKLEWDFQNDASDRVNQLTDDNGDQLNIRHADIWLKGSIGKVSIGQGDFASNGTSEVDLSGTDVASYSSFTDVGSSFIFRNTGTGIGIATLGRSYNNLDGAGRGSRIRYDTPEFAGFIVSASWGEDDVWDVALRFKQKLGDFQLAAAIAYTDESVEEASDNANSRLQINGVNIVDDSSLVSGSVSLMHTPSGINLTFAAGQRDHENLNIDSQFWYAKAGIKQNWTSLGATAISFDYGKGEDFSGFVLLGSYFGNEVTHYGAQIVQNIDAAAMELYAAYSHNELDSVFAAEDVDLFMVGSRIKF